jgi:hypothetical protein
MTVHAVPHHEPQTSTPVVVCADCTHCKVFKETAASGRYVLRVRCTRERWRRGKDGTVVATYHFHTVLRRRVQGCPDYLSLSDGPEDRAEYLDQLADELPVERIVYEPDGEPADLVGRR